MKMTYQPKKRQRSKVHGFRKLQMVEKCLPKEELREERNCLHKVRFLLTFSSPW